MLAQRQLPGGPITSLLGLPFFAYTGTCHKRVALQSELYSILCLLLAGGASSSDTVVLERFARRCMTSDHVPSAVASCVVDVCVCSIEVALCTCVSVASFMVPHCVVEVAMCVYVSLASFMVPHCVIEVAVCACVIVASFRVPHCVVEVGVCVSRCVLCSRSG